MKINLDQIKDAYVFITPTFLKGETVRYKLKFTHIIFGIVIFSTAIILLTTFILSFSPLKNIVYHFDNVELEEQAKKTIELEKKVIFLTKELESISSENKKLKYAFILGTSDSLDSSSAVYDSLKYESKKNLPYGGNIAFIWKVFWDNIFQLEFDYFIKPSKGLIINDFKPDEGHFGVDFAVQPGTSIFAARGGLVIFSDFTIDDGHKIIIQHDNGYITVYKHCSTLLKRERDTVVQGELIAFSGNSGEKTTGPHLHFEIWKDGKPLNPKEFFIK